MKSGSRSSTQNIILIAVPIEDVEARMAYLVVSILDGPNEVSKNCRNRQVKGCLVPMNELVRYKSGSENLTSLPCTFLFIG
jgi:hypothetical protein